MKTFRKATVLVCAFLVAAALCGCKAQIHLGSPIAADADVTMGIEPEGTAAEDEDTAYSTEEEQEEQTGSSESGENETTRKRTTIQRGPRVLW